MEGVSSHAYAFSWAGSKLNGEAGDKDDDDSEDEDNGDSHQEGNGEGNGWFNESEEVIEKLTVKVLQLRLQDLKLPVYGLKAEFIDRLGTQGKSTENIVIFSLLWSLHHWFSREEIESKFCFEYWQIQVIIWG